MNESRPRKPLFSSGSILRKRPPATPARLAVGAVLFAGCALGAWLTIPRPDVRVINASGQSITVMVSAGEGTVSQKLGIDRVWAVEQKFTGGGSLHFEVGLPNRQGVKTTLAAFKLPLRVAVDESGQVAPR
ncbi:hypothetical protein [Deinococcus arenicola]|uniref:Uncharacterized protein n=1 Tax=Deinococcus arenicola TaxID=2994950 RepID=A0ABU4DU69_9DEIO|nr:hypothetical protein [Deinococcus sp. ZS9-10]MDV6375928.1 hypothetical protein [Deinococcus sp. ZS9-10]